MTDSRPRLMAAGEVTAVVAAASLLFHTVRLSPLRRWEMALVGVEGVAPLEYTVVLMFIFTLLFVTRRRPDAWGLTFRPPGVLLRVVAVALGPFLVLGASLSSVNWRHWSGALVVSLLNLAVLIIIALALRENGAPAKVVLLVVPLLVPSAFDALGGLIGVVARKTLYVYLLVAPTEETLFRGYAQSRLNEAWGRPYRFFGVPWGWGLIVTSLLFGLWHVLLMPFVPGVWLQAAWTTVAGLVFGYLRERSGSVVPPSLLHGVMNYVPFTELLTGGG